MNNLLEHVIDNKLYLNKELSLKYYIKKRFRNSVNSFVSENNLLLSLRLFDCDDVTDVNVLKNAHLLCLSCCRNITDVSLLGHVYDLDLSCCTNITDVSMLGNVHTLNLSECYIIDVDALGNVYDLDLNSCRDVSDVDMLGNVHTLNISYCQDIFDVSALATVHSLDLTGCINISDITMLGNVDTLNLSWCKHITNVNFLTNVKSLNLEHCYHIKYIYRLSLVHIYLNSCIYGLHLFQNLTNIYFTWKSNKFTISQNNKINKFIHFRYNKFKNVSETNILQNQHNKLTLSNIGEILQSIGKKSNNSYRSQSDELTNVSNYSSHTIDKCNFCTIKFN